MPIFVDRPGAGWLIGTALSGGSGSLLIIDGISKGWAGRAAGALRILGIQFRELDFDFVDDIHLPDGSRAIEQIYFKAAPVLVRRVESDPDYGPAVAAAVRKESHEPYARAFLAKKILSEAHLDLRSIHVSSWYRRTRFPEAAEPAVLYVPDSWLFAALKEYARQWNVELRAQPKAGIPLGTMGRLARSRGKQAYLFFRGFRPAQPAPAGGSPRIAAEMCWNGVKRDPLYHTEFFWYRKPALPAGALLGYFMNPQDQPDGERRAELEKAGIGWIGREEMRRLMYTPLNDKTVRASAGSGLRVPGTKTARAVRERLAEFYSEYDRWRRFFAATGTKIHVSTYDVFPASEAVHAALADAGGLSVSIQRSIEREPYVLRRTVTDVHFAFSKAQAEKERLSGSIVRQHVTAGFPYDDVFEAARVRGREVAAGLRARGVEFILCFFDENDGMRVHRKWLGGEKLIQGDYAFLCGRLEEDRTLGLVLKPKRAETLAERLGPVWPRLKALVDAGRCVILSGTAPDERYLPCVGACSADISINLLYGGTTGLESYLAGTRAVLIRHGVELGSFGRLPEASVVFDAWDDLWKEVLRFRADRNDPLLGNWEPVVEEFASLRDGKGSERIRQYIVWLYEAFAAGKDREQTLEEAGMKYRSRWGREWISEIGPASREPAEEDLQRCSA